MKISEILCFNRQIEKRGMTPPSTLSLHASRVYFPSHRKKLEINQLFFILHARAFPRFFGYYSNSTNCKVLGEVGRMGIGPKIDTKVPFFAK